MKKQINQVIEFHKAFGVETAETPRALNFVQMHTRYRMMRDELEEYIDAENMPEIADALGDQLYVLLGTIAQHGMADVIEEVFDRIHANNMSKLDENGKPIINGQNGVYFEDQPMGKILKPAGFKPVELGDLF